MSSDRALSAPSSIRRMYFWGPLSERKGWKSVTTLEEGRMISGGEEIKRRRVDARTKG